MTVASGVWSPMRSSRESSRSACSSTFSGISASAIFVRYSSTTEASSSPSSLRIESSWRRRMYSRCCFSTPDSTSSWIRWRTCMSARRSRWSSSASSSRSRTSTVSRSRTFCSKVRSGEYPDVSASAPGSEMERTNAAMRPSSPRSSRIASTTARYSRSSSRIRPSTDSSSGLSSTSTNRRPCESLAAAPATPRCSPLRATARPPPGSLMRSVTSATVPTFAYSPSCLGTSRTRSSSPTSTVRVTFMWGKTTMSSRGTSSRRTVSIDSVLTFLAFVLLA